MAKGPEKSQKDSLLLQWNFLIFVRLLSRYAASVISRKTIMNVFLLNGIPLLSPNQNGITG